MSVLVVIDMQPTGHDAAAHPQTLAACQREIKRAVRHRSFIFFVVYVGAGRTDARLTRITKGYSRKAFVYKNRDDGSIPLMQAANNLEVSLRGARICGVNASCCVEDTVKRLPYDCVLVADALGDECGSSPSAETYRRESVRAAIKSMKRNSNYKRFVLYANRMIPPRKAWC